MRVIRVLSALMLGFPLTAAAQRITITPVIGPYLHLGTQRSSHATRTSTFPGTPFIDHVRARVSPAAAIGFKVAGTSRRLGFEASLMTAAPDQHMACPVIYTDWQSARDVFCAVRQESWGTAIVPSSQGLTLRLRQETRVLFLSARFLVRVQLAPTLDATLGAGPAWVRSGTTTGATNVGEEVYGWVGYDVPLEHYSVGLSTSASLGLTLAPGKRIEFGLTHHAYRLNFGQRGGADRELNVQHDVIATIGVPVGVRLP